MARGRQRHAGRWAWAQAGVRGPRGGQGGTVWYWQYRCRGGGISLLQPERSGADPAAILNAY